MKNILLSIVLLLFVSACGNCDSDPEPALRNMAGIYAMTSWNAPVSTDLNNNGIPSRNLMDETDCYDNSHIVLSEDMTYTKSYHFAEAVDASIACNSESSTGTWSTNGNVVRLLSADGGEIVYAYGSVNKILTQSETNLYFPISDGGLIYHENGPVNMVFEKQE
jgi:hypothetical protein